MRSFVAGIDEAGRGPLIGDMFMAMVIIDGAKEVSLKNMGVKDSKKLTRDRRENLFKIILGIAEAIIVTRIPPEAIDRENLNMLEAKALCKLITKSSRIAEISKIYIDAFAHPDKVKEYIKRCVSTIDLNKIVIEYNADGLYTVVGAASIMAKVLRDKHIEMLKKVYGDFGSGYPSDKRTISWLKTYYQSYSEIPPIVRKSWRTVKNILHRDLNLNR